MYVTRAVKFGQAMKDVDGEVYTWSQLLAMTSQLAASLQHALNVTRASHKKSKEII